MSGPASSILARLSELEAQQKTLMSDMSASHSVERDALRARIAAASARRRSAESVEAAPVLMELNMREIDAAVQAASAAEQESAAALGEAREVAARAKGSHGNQMVVAGGSGKRGVGVEGGGGGTFEDYGGDNEFIVKQVNVNLDDVERIINGSPLVEVCRAFGRPDPKFGNEVYCCVVPRRGVRVSEPMLMLYAQKYLSTALCPKRFFFLDSLPVGITRRVLAETRMGEKKAGTAAAAAGGDDGGAPAS